MTWTVQIDEQDGLTVYDLKELHSTVAGILMGAGLAPQMALTFARTAQDEARGRDHQRRMAWGTPPLEYPHPLPDGRVVWVRSLSDPPEEPNKRCDGLNMDGDRCGQHLNHRGSC